MTRRVVSSALALAALLGAALRLGPGDRTAALALVHYATPWIVLGTLAALAAWIWPARTPERTSRIRGVGLLVFVACGLGWAAASRGGGADEPGDGSVLRLALWNVARGGFASWERLARGVEALDADVVVLIEAGSDRGPAPRWWHRRFENRDVAAAHAIVLISRDEIVRFRPSSPEDSPHRNRYVDAIVRRPDGDVRLLLVDLAVYRVAERRERIARLARVAERSLPGEGAPTGEGSIPTVVVGDFNTPAYAGALDPLRRRFSDAFVTAGEGIHATWPTPVPLVAIDQVWVAEGVRPVRVSTRGPWVSDHRIVVAELEIDRDARPAGNGATGRVQR